MEEKRKGRFGGIGDIFANANNYEVVETSNIYECPGCGTDYYVAEEEVENGRYINCDECGLIILLKERNQ
jgi:DNA-directed RNA polymerase subunit RPC12/RpoP